MGGTPQRRADSRASGSEAGKDNLMQRTSPFPSIGSLGPQIGAAIERHLDWAFRRMARTPLATHDDRFVRVVTGEPHPFGNFAVVCDPGDLESTQAASVPLCACGAPAAMIYANSAVAPPVDACLRESGFVAQPPMPAMAAEIDRLAATSLPAGYQFTRVGGGGQGKAWTEAFAAGYEIPLRVAEVFSPEAGGVDMAPDAPVQFFAIFKDARPVSTSLMFLEGGLAGIYCVATIPGERGKGLGAYATAEPLRRARELGYGVGVLQSSAAGHSLYRRLGFADFGGVPMYVRMP